jgi:hypothetical protein
LHKTLRLAQRTSRNGSRLSVWQCHHSSHLKKKHQHRPLHPARLTISRSRLGVTIQQTDRWARNGTPDAAVSAAQGTRRIGHGGAQDLMFLAAAVA